jgi:hypothetical protein
VVVEDSLELGAALRTEKFPVETHLFANGGHGFGLRWVVGKPLEIWPDLFVNWSKTMNLIQEFSDENQNQSCTDIDACLWSCRLRNTGCRRRHLKSMRPAK